MPSKKPKSKAYKLIRKFAVLVVLLIIVVLSGGALLHIVEKELGTTTGYHHRCTAGFGFLYGVDLASSIVTALGYGHIFPCTGAGKLVTLLVTFIGLPLTLVVLDQLGKVFVFLTRKGWNAIKNKICRKKNVEENDDIMLESELPITLGLVMAIGWMLITSMYFSWLEDWPFLDAGYFTVISMTTVGLADYTEPMVPYTMINYYFMFIGLALFSMVINIIGEKINNAFTKARNEVNKALAEHADKGGSKEDTDEIVENVLKQQGFAAQFFNTSQMAIIEQDAAKPVSNTGVQTSPPTTRNVNMMVRLPWGALEADNFPRNNKERGTRSHGENRAQKSPEGSKRNNANRRSASAGSRSRSRGQMRAESSDDESPSGGQEKRRSLAKRRRRQVHGNAAWRKMFGADE